MCGGGRLGRERRWVIAGQQSRELVKLQVTLNPPLEAQREFQEHDLEPPEDSSEGKDFRDWGVWLSDPFSIPQGNQKGPCHMGEGGSVAPRLRASCRACLPGFEFWLCRVLAVDLGQVAYSAGACFQACRMGIIKIPVSLGYCEDKCSRTFEVVAKCFLCIRYSIKIRNLFFILVVTFHGALPPCRPSGRPEMGYGGMEGFLPVSILPSHG